MSDRVARYLTGIAFAKYCGVSQPAVAQAKKTCLKPAFNLSGLIDREHPAAVDYYEKAERRKRQYSSGRIPSGVKRKPAAPTVDLGESDSDRQSRLIADLPEDIRALGDMSLNKILTTYGSGDQLLHLLKCVHEMEKIHKNRLSNAKEEGALVAWQLVDQGILGQLNTFFERLLSDGSKTIESIARVKVMSGADEAETRTALQRVLQGFIKDLKSKLKIAVREAAKRGVK